MGSISRTNEAPNGHRGKNGAERGQRLLPNVVDDFAANDPDYVMGMTTIASDTLPLKFNRMTASQFANAVNYTSRWIDNIVEANSKEAIGFIGLQDFRYWVMEIAAMKTGHPILLPSPRNALSNTVHLLGTSQCDILFYTEGPLEAQAKALQALTPGLKIYQVPSLAEMISTKTKHYQYNKTYEKTKYERAMILHTSGSTGNPKPIFITHEYLARADIDHLVPEVEGRLNATLDLLSSPVYNGSPFFHLSGVIMGMLAMFLGTTPIICPPEMVATPQLACDIASSIELKSVVAAPHVIDTLFAEQGEKLIKSFSKLENVVWFGGPLAHATGEWVVKNLPHTQIWQFYGSTEAAWHPTLIPPKTHWPYLEFHPELGPTLEPIDPSDPYSLHELVIHPHPDPTFSWCRSIFYVFPDKNEYRTRDLFRRCEEPGFENLWKFESRLDDIMILNNALKLNPLHVEVPLQVHPLLKGVLVVGEGKMRCGIVLEPKDHVERDGLVEKVWEDVEKANAQVPEHARVHKELAVVADPERPFIRASKGTVVRSWTTKLYATDIEEVYAKAG